MKPSAPVAGSRENTATALLPHEGKSPGGRVAGERGDRVVEAPGRVHASAVGRGRDPGGLVQAIDPIRAVLEECDEAQSARDRLPGKRGDRVLLLPRHVDVLAV